MIRNGKWWFIADAHPCHRILRSGHDWADVEEGFDRRCPLCREAARNALAALAGDEALEWDTQWRTNDE